MSSIAAAQGGIKLTIRGKLRVELMRMRPVCGLCGAAGTDLHEIVCPLRDKYHPRDDDPLAQAVYCKENCVMLCNQCNVLSANSMRDILIRHNMDVYGVDAVVQAYRRMASLLTSPTSWIPYSIDYGGETVVLL